METVKDDKSGTRVLSLNAQLRKLLPFSEPQCPCLLKYRHLIKWSPKPRLAMRSLNLLNLSILTLGNEVGNHLASKRKEHFLLTQESNASKILK